MLDVLLPEKMMRPISIRAAGEQRASRRRARRRAARATAEQPTAPLPVEAIALALRAGSVSPSAGIESLDLDFAVERVREAGGPIDRASYSCSCGYVFSAAVTTTVSCPNCGCGQAW
jgi:hypothetical protein